MNKKVERFRGQILLTAVAVFALVASMIGGSYAIFSSSTSVGEYNVLSAGNLEISYVEGEDGYGDILSLNGQYPQMDPTSLTDLENMKAYRFNITNTGDIPLDYRIKIEYDEAIIKEDGCSNKKMAFSDIKYNFDKKLENNVPVTAKLSATTNHIIYDSAAANQPGLQPGSSQIHEIRLWIASDASNSVLGSHFHGKVVIESVQSGVDMRLMEEYKIGKAVTLVDGSQWYVLEDAPSTSATIKLFAASNVSTGQANNQMKFDESDNRPKEANSGCSGYGSGCNAYEANGSTVIKDSSIKTWLETEYLTGLKESLTSAGGTVEDLTVSLPSMEELVHANGTGTFNGTIFTFSTANNKSFLTSTSYWTKTAKPDNTYTSYVWFINSNTKKSQTISASSTDFYYNKKWYYVGVRPVIVTSKLNIQ